MKIGTYILPSRSYKNRPLKINYSHTVTGQVIKIVHNRLQHFNINNIFKIKLARITFRRKNTFQFKFNPLFADAEIFCWRFQPFIGIKEFKGHINRREENKIAGVFNNISVTGNLLNHFNNTLLGVGSEKNYRDVTALQNLPRRIRTINSRAKINIH